MQKVVILGAGGLAREVLWIFHEVNKCKPQWDILGFMGEAPANHRSSLCDPLCTGRLQLVRKYESPKCR